ncbi:LysR family transcriptional regulator [Pseudomonas extremaustralis]|jgi:DNA-binding transcriptional LysR family regulator|uniref:LysR family transcriptional regulator n=1 Tax=Pseudomonas extremaustralis TaxID=359110 RepID=A0A5C5Q5B3_9PSED|nr:LysR family transcriptional regulator [Pseudomonas extremaustralis]EZI24908.1 LysR family transcriptional regulator [Pseudomonas extremaustralis 14-3 substr. 14-3b]MDF3134220.1 LysR family transcriptional regulator [Pseudomonas extremaustralis]TWS00973.1 LysR family transcriptional regulator [Pseudomonas extremaustralis]SDF20716.1 transcriptional regulator, LysR family [Pseudomonas extremaustralis]SKB10124.1 transcriptional regulator, LysR family [Pseudomonas extremaustralis]
MDRALEMQVFCTVVDKGTFVGAAEPLGMSKAAISRYVSALEERLGARLLHRTTRRLALTEEGRQFYHQAREVLALMAQAEEAVSATAPEPSGVLRVNAPVSFGVLHLAPLWGEFMQAYPQVELDISLNDRLVDLVEEGFDAAVRIARMENSSLVGRRLASTRMCLFASPDYLARHPPIRTLADLADHGVIAYTHFAMGNEWQFDGPDGSETVRTRSSARCNNGDTCRSIALSGAGIALQPSFMVAEDLRSGALVEILPAYRSIELGIYVVYPSRKHLASKVRALIHFLAERFSHPQWER